MEHGAGNDVLSPPCVDRPATLESALLSFPGIRRPHGRTQYDHGPAVRPHGKYHIVVEDDVLLTAVRGSWNAEGTQLYCDAVREAVTPMKKPYAHIVDARGWELAVPETADMLSDLLDWRVAHGLACTAYLDLGAPVLRAFAESYVGSVRETVPTDFFAETTKLSEWISAHGFCVPARILTELASPRANFQNRN